jgi:hypothetical protein
MVMRAFISNQRPRSVNAKYTDKFKDYIRESCKVYCEPSEQLQGLLYGIVYYFHKRTNELDADNLSKPIWDALEGMAFEDDLLIQMRHAGIVDLRSTDMTAFDLSRMPDTVAETFIQMIGVEDHILYVELGRLHQSMFVFGCEIAEEE